MDASAILAVIRRVVLLASALVVLGGLVTFAVGVRKITGVARNINLAAKNPVSTKLRTR